MKKPFITLLLLFSLLLLFASPALARLTLGVVVGQDSTQSVPPREKIREVTRQLYQSFQEEIVVREFVSSAATLKWLDQFAALDFALLSAEDINNNKGRFLIVGPLDNEGQINLVARQGVNASVAQKAADLIRAQGFSPWRPGDDVEVSAAAPAPSVPEVVEPAEMAIKDVAAASVPEQSAETAVLMAVIPELQGVLRSTEQANLLAKYVAKSLPVEIKVKEFADVDSFADWFMRYRMIDFAVIPEAVAEAKLGHDYIALAEFVSRDAAVDSEIFVGRRGENTLLQDKLRKVLVDSHLNPAGKASLAGLGVDRVKEYSATEEAVAADTQAEDVFSQLYVVKAPDLPPEEPVRPADVPVESIPELPVIKHGNLPPEPAVADLLPSSFELEEPKVQPQEPTVADAVTSPEKIEAPVAPEPPAVISQPVELPPEDQGIDVPEKKLAEVEAVNVEVSPPPTFSEPDEGRTVEQTLEPAVEPQVVEEVMDPSSPPEANVETEAPIEIRDDDIVALLGEDAVAAMVAQPEIPRELRPPGIPVVRPGRVADRKPAIDEGLFLTSLPEPMEQAEPEELPQLLPPEEQDPGIVYIIPFVAIMVPRDVHDRIFDRFIDALIMEEEKLELQFVILKGGLKKVSPEWLRARKYVTGEIYGYVEEAGSTVTDLRAKAKIDYHTPGQEQPTFSYLHPVSRLLDRDAATIEEERIKLADDIANALINQILKALNS